MIASASPRHILLLLLLALSPACLFTRSANAPGAETTPPAPDMSTPLDMTQPVDCTPAVSKARVCEQGCGEMTDALCPDLAPVDCACEPGLSCESGQCICTDHRAAPTCTDGQKVGFCGAATYMACGEITIKPCPDTCPQGFFCNQSSHYCEAATVADPCTQAACDEQGLSCGVPLECTKPEFSCQNKCSATDMCTLGQCVECPVTSMELACGSNTTSPNIRCSSTYTPQCESQDLLLCDQTPRSCGGSPCERPVHCSGVVIANPSNNGTDNFGHAVLVHEKYLLVGAPKANLAGRVYLYDLSTSPPTLLDTLSATAAHRGLGTALAWFPAEEAFLIGAPASDVVISVKLAQDGASFERPTLTPFKVPSNNTGANFGATLSTPDSNAKIFVVGAPTFSQDARAVGRAFVFELDEEAQGYKPTGILEASDLSQAGARFGESVLLTTYASQEFVLVGAPGVTYQREARSGEIFVFSRSNSGGWGQYPPTLANLPLQVPNTIEAPDGTKNYGAAMSALGDFVYVGAPASVGVSRVSTITYDDSFTQKKWVWGGGPRFESADYMYGASMATHGKLLVFDAGQKGGTESKVRVESGEGAAGSSLDLSPMIPEGQTQSAARFGQAVSMQGSWLAVGAPDYKPAQQDSQAGGVYLYDTAAFK